MNCMIVSSFPPCFHLCTASIEYLNLSNNAIDEQGAFLLAGGLETNCKLKRLVLDHNQLTQPGARAIQMSGVRDDHAIVISMLDCGIARDSHL